MLRRALPLALAALALACSSGGEIAPEQAAPPETVEEQYRLALAGTPDDEAAAIAEAIAAELDAGELAALESLDFGSAGAPELLAHAGFMRAWGVVVVELSGMTPLHAVDHPGCDVVEETLAGWSAAAGSTALEITGSSIAGAHAPVAVLFVAKKDAQTFRSPLHLPFDHANVCAAERDPEDGCGMPGEACCGDTCAGGTTCLGGLCL
jgi:hypothetical protein